MKKHTISRTCSLLLAAAFALLATNAAFGQDRMLYEAFRKAWLEPDGFDEYVAMNQPFFNSQGYHNATFQLKENFQLLYPREVHLKALLPEEFGWHARSYVCYLMSHPGAGMAVFLTDMERVAYGRDCWEETCSGKVSYWLQDKREQNFKNFLRINERALQAIGPEAARKYMAIQRQADLEPLYLYLDIMEPHFLLPSLAELEQ